MIWYDRVRRVSLLVLLSMLTGSFASAQIDFIAFHTYNLDFPYRVVPADVDQDGHVDLTVANALSPKFAAGGNNLKLAQTFSLTCLISGFNFLVIPPVATALFAV